MGWPAQMDVIKTVLKRYHRLIALIPLLLLSTIQAALSALNPHFYEEDLKRLSVINNSGEKLKQPVVSLYLKVIK